MSCSIAAVFFLCPLHSSVDFHHSSPHVRRRGELWKPSEDHYRVLSSRVFRSSDRGARVDKRALRERGAVFGLLPLSTCALSIAGRPVLILGSILVLPWPLSVCLVAVV